MKGYVISGIFIYNNLYSVIYNGKQLMFPLEKDAREFKSKVINGEIRL